MSALNSCPFCGCEALEKREIIETFEYKGREFEVPNYIVWECNKCKEEIVDKQTMKSSAKLIKDFYRKVDGLLPASEIKRIRIKLGYNQNDLSILLGGGEKSFARYENSIIIQSESMDNLLRVLDKYPHAIGVLEQKHAISKPTVMSFKAVIKPREQILKVANW